MVENVDTTMCSFSAIITLSKEGRNFRDLYCVKSDIASKLNKLVAARLFRSQTGCVLKFSVFLDTTRVCFAGLCMKTKENVSASGRKRKPKLICHNSALPWHSYKRANSREYSVEGQA